jgi:DNA helicase-2/ATP-dependent DNA helicase PcrA
MKFEPTPEQSAIIDAVRGTKDNIIVHALAGAAKTSTLVLIAKAQQSIPVLTLAFNKKIAVEMQERLPGNCTAMTLNSLGHRTWSTAIGKRIVIKSGKTYEIVKDLIESMPPHERGDAYEIMSDLIRNVDMGKTCGYIPTGKFDMAKRLMDDEEFFAHLDEEPSALMEDLIRAATFESIAQALNGILDYNDQILMPTCFHGSFPSFPLVLIDEAQDLSALNHAMLRKIVRKRVIAVGDENQAIYGFRGAHADSMRLLAQTFEMKRFDLSISFRCPIAVVKEARARAPSMQWPEWAIEGEVRTLPVWNADTIPREATILCRNNAPLFSMAVKMLRAGRYPEIIGNDIGKGLLKIMKKLGKAEMPTAEAEEALTAWLDSKLAKSRDPGKLHDQAECIRVFLEQGSTLGEAIAYAEHLFTSSGPIKLSTVHKAKGLEYDTVFIIERELFRLDRGQDKNLLYVAQTRAKQSLTYATINNFQEVENENA